MPILINLVKGDSMFCSKDLDNRVFFLRSIEGFSSGPYMFSDSKSGCVCYFYDFEVPTIHSCIKLYSSSICAESLEFDFW